MRNPYKRFAEIGAGTPRTVGTCISADFGECVIQYPGGGVAQIRGAGTIGTSYFVVDGRLDGEAAALTPLTIEV